ncbi:hypothetical protein KEM56_006179 [Ascosphaera pollenicola]|nr:hypothetical protein KEM56_006179 [Ascosphaera pollenicola]
MSALTIPTEVQIISIASQELNFYQIPLTTPIQRQIVLQTWKSERRYGVTMWKSIDNVDWNQHSELFDTALLAQAGGHIAK